MTCSLMDLKAKPVITLGMSGSAPSQSGNCGWVLDGESLGNTGALRALFTDVCFFTIYGLIKKEEHLK